VLTGAYEEATPYFRHLMANTGERSIGESVALLLIEDEEEAESQNRGGLAKIIGGHASRAPAFMWPDDAEFSSTIEAAHRSRPRGGRTQRCCRTAAHA
jgi:hypothetical protein